MSHKKTYSGSCHCGAVHYEVAMAAPEKAFACNCSICSRQGWLLAFVPAADFRLFGSEADLTDYQFGSKHSHHPFCRLCGIRSFSRGVDGDGMPRCAINLRCLAGLDPSALPVHTFDGAAT